MLITEESNGEELSRVEVRKCVSKTRCITVLILRVDMICLPSVPKSFASNFLEGRRRHGCTSQCDSSRQLLHDKEGIDF